MGTNGSLIMGLDDWDQHVAIQQGLELLRLRDNLNYIFVDNVILDVRVHLGARQNTGVTLFAVFPYDGFKRHRCALIGLAEAIRLPAQHRTGIDTVAARQTSSVPCRFKADSAEAVVGLEPLGQHAAARYRRLLDA
jgi:hypothetical protein